MDRVQAIKESLEELMKNRELMRVQAQKVNLMIDLLERELARLESSTETRIQS
jgi:hypothetical protein